MENSNSKYENTYCTSANDKLSASTSLNYNSLFTFESDGRIKSVAKGTYCNGSNGDISFEASGTTYTFRVNGEFNQMTSTTTSGWQTVTTYIRQTNNTNVTIENNSSDSYWSFYPIVVELQE
ncbi:MAG: hypothetical protein IKY24_01945 [Alistipes sp.]|nr:hypothetical protein [Alistipes sp.]